MTEIVDGAVDQTVDPGQDPAPAPEPVAQESYEDPPQDATPDPAPTPEYTPAQQAQIQAYLRTVLESRDKQWQERLAQIQQTPSPEPAAPSPGTPDVTEDIDAEIAALYSPDEAGTRTRSAIEKHVKLLLKKSGLDKSGLTLEDVRKIAAEESGVVRNELRSGLSVTQEVQDLASRGVIGDDDISEVQKRYNQVLAQPGMQQAAANPNNAPWILKGVVYDLVKEGKIKPYSKPRRPTNPLAPSGPGGAPKPEPIDPSKSPFSSVRNMKKEELEAVRNLSTSNYRRANGG